jgi:hypothetical protein
MSVRESLARRAARARVLDASSSPAARPAIAPHVSAALESFVGTGDVSPADPYAVAKKVGLLAYFTVSIGSTLYFVFASAAGRRAAYRSGYVAGKAARR